MSCTKAQTDADAVEALKDNIDYYPVAVTVMNQIGTNQIEFTAPGPAITTHIATWGDRNQMWASCPSTVVEEVGAGEPGARPDKDASGTLYLSQQYVWAEQNATPSRKIYTLRDPKWPRKELGEPPYAVLKLSPTSIMISGFGRHGGSFELLDPLLAAGQQTITRDPRDGHIEVIVSEPVFKRFGRHFPWSQHAAKATKLIEAQLRSESRDPFELAAAWQVIAEYEADRQAGRVDLNSKAEAATASAVDKLLGRS